MHTLFFLHVSLSKHSPINPIHNVLLRQSVVSNSFGKFSALQSTSLRQTSTSWFATVPRSADRVICVLTSAHSAFNGPTAAIWILGSGCWRRCTSHQPAYCGVPAAVCRTLNCTKLYWDCWCPLWCLLRLGLGFAPRRNGISSCGVVMSLQM